MAAVERGGSGGATESIGSLKHDIGLLKEVKDTLMSSLGVCSVNTLTGTHKGTHFRLLHRCLCSRSW